MNITIPFALPEMEHREMLALAREKHLTPNALLRSSLRLLRKYSEVRAQGLRILVSDGDYTGELQETVAPFIDPNKVRLIRQPIAVPFTLPEVEHREMLALAKEKHLTPNALLRSGLRLLKRYSEIRAQGFRVLVSDGDYERELGELYERTAFKHQRPLGNTPGP